MRSRAVELALRASRRVSRITLSQLRAEGVIEVDVVGDTSVLFVTTRVGLHLFHAEHFGPESWR